MYLSGKLTSTGMKWELKVTSEFGRGFLPPAKGLIIPMPGAVFGGKVLSSDECFTLRGQTILDLIQIGIVFSYDGSICHISLQGKALCDNVKHPEVGETVVSTVHLCQMCQYNFWRSYG